MLLRDVQLSVNLVEQNPIISVMRLITLSQLTEADALAGNLPWEAPVGDSRTRSAVDAWSLVRRTQEELRILREEEIPALIRFATTRVRTARTHGAGSAVPVTTNDTRYSLCRPLSLVSCLGQQRFLGGEVVRAGVYLKHTLNALRQFVPEHADVRAAEDELRGFAALTKIALPEWGEFTAARPEVQLSDVDPDVAANVDDAMLHGGEEGGVVEASSDGDAVERLGEQLDESWDMAVVAHSDDEDDDALDCHEVHALDD